MAEQAGSSNKVVSNSIIYTAGGLLQKCFSFFLLPLYTVYLTTEDYGITSIANSFVGVAVIIAMCSMHYAVTRFYVELKEKPQKLKRFYGTVAIFSILSCLATGVILTIFRDILIKYVFAGVDYYPVVLICLLQIVFHSQQTIYTYIITLAKKTEL